MTLAGIVLALLAAGPLVPCAVLFAEALLALHPPRRRPMAPPGERPRVGVVVPAHDESLLVEGTVRSIAVQLSGADRLLVVADNCSDDTAAKAAAAGAEVIERRDEKRRGKGYALDFGVRHLKADPVDVVVVIDADCQPGAGAVDLLAAKCMNALRPVQASYLMQLPAQAALAARLAQFAWLVRNRVRPLGCHRLGLPCQLMGSGMAFPWGLISAAPLATAHIAEDLILGIALARSGAPPLFCPEAEVRGFFPATAEGRQAQHLRWEHGHLAALLGEAPRLLAEGLHRRDYSRIALALDVMVPPLSLLALSILALAAASALLLLADARALVALGLTAAAFVLLASTVLVSWLRYGRDVLPLSDLLHVPAYALSKVPIYLRFVGRRQMEWVRSRRGP